MTESVTDILNKFSGVTGRPELTKEVATAPAETPLPYSGIPTYGQQQNMFGQYPQYPPQYPSSGGLLPSSWHNQPRMNAVEMSDTEIGDLAKLSVLFQVRVQQVLSEGAKYFLVKVLRRNKARDEETVNKYDEIENPTPDEKQAYEDANERLERLIEVETQESAMSIKDFESLLIRIKTAELKHQRDTGTLELPSTWGVTWNLVGLNISGLLGSNLKVFGDAIYAFKGR
jgi:hypothetical protein